MDISLNITAPPIQHETQTQRRSQNNCEDIASDLVRTSKRALILSRNLAPLKESLLPREDVLKKFADSLDRPVDLDAKALDSILDQM